MLVQTRYLLGLAAFVAVVAAGCAKQESGTLDTTATVTTSDTNPMSALGTMGKYLQTLKTFRVDVDATKDEPLDDGENLQFAGTVSYLVRAPDGLRADLKTDRKQRQYIYDGKTLTVYAPRMNYYATVAAPPTIRAVLDSAASRYDLEFPVADLFLWGTDRAELDSIKSSAYVGPASIRGRDCDHFVFRQSDVDWQLWIERGAKPLPCKLVITTTSLPTRPAYSAVITWDLAPKIDGSSFVFAKPRNASPIKLRDFADTTATTRAITGK